MTEMTIPQLAARLGLSESTILQKARRLGMAKYKKVLLFSESEAAKIKSVNITHVVSSSSAGAAYTYMRPNPLRDIDNFTIVTDRLLERCKE